MIHGGVVQRNRSIVGANAVPCLGGFERCGTGAATAPGMRGEVGSWLLARELGVAFVGECRACCWF